MQISLPALITAALSLSTPPITTTWHPPNGNDNVRGAPGTPLQIRFDDRINYIEATGDADEFMVVAYGANSEPIGSIALWHDSGGDVYLASDYEEGSALLRLDLETFEVVVEYSDIPAELLSERAKLIEAHWSSQRFAEDKKKDRGKDKDTWFGCGLMVAIAAGACAGTVVNPIVAPGCFGATGVATCKCISAWAEKKGKRKCDI